MISSLIFRRSGRALPMVIASVKSSSTLIPKGTARYFNRYHPGEVMGISSSRSTKYMTASAMVAKITSAVIS